MTFNLMCWTCVLYIGNIVFYVGGFIKNTNIYLCHRYVSVNAAMPPETSVNINLHQFMSFPKLPKSFKKAQSCQISQLATLNILWRKITVQQILNSNNLKFNSKLQYGVLNIDNDNWTYLDLHWPYLTKKCSWGKWHRQCWGRRSFPGTNSTRADK